MSDGSVVGSGEPAQPPVHPHAAAVLAAIEIPTLTPELIGKLREQNKGDADDLTSKGLARRDVEVPARDGATVMVSLFRREGDDETGPGYVFLHGGGMVSGDRFDAGDMVEIVQAWGGTLASVEYRLAPEHSGDVPVEDCWAATAWLVSHARELGIDPERVFVAGTSAGGGLAAGVLLLARERGLRLAGGWLNCPMLDDRNDTTSVRQFWTRGLFWNGLANATGWAALLGGRADVAAHVAPGRAQDLSGLPPVLLTVGECEPFRDEVVAFASRLWRDGTTCELLVVPGGIHCYVDAIPDADISHLHRDVVRRWFASRLHPDTRDGAAAAIERLRPVAGTYQD